MTDYLYRGQPGLDSLNREITDGRPAHLKNGGNIALFEWPSARIRHGTREGFWREVRAGKKRCPDCEKWALEHRVEAFQ